MTNVSTPFFRNALLIVTIAAVNTILQLVNFALLSNYLSIENFGEYRIFLSVISFSGLFHAGYLDGLIIKWLINKTIPVMSEFVLFTAITVVTPLVLFFLPLIELNNAYMVIFTIVLNLSAFATSIFFKINLFVIAPLTTIISQLSLSLFLLSDDHSPTVVEVVQFTLIVATVTTFVILLLGIKKHLLSLKFDKKSLSLATVKKDLSIGIPILITGFFFLAIFNIDKIILPLYFLNKREFGYYSFASSVISVIIGIFVSASSLIFKKFVDYESHKMITDFYNKGFKAIFFISIIQLIALPMLQWLISSYLPKYVLSFRTIMGFSYFIFPVLLLQLYINNIYKTINKVRIFLMIAVIFTAILATVYFTAQSFFSSIEPIPYFIAQLLIIFVFINEYLLCRFIPQMRKNITIRIGMLCIYNICLLFSFLNCKFIV